MSRYRAHFLSIARFVCLSLVGAMTATWGPAHAGDSEPWRGPFGGSFNANFTVTTDYSYAGISEEVAIAYAFALAVTNTVTAA